MYKEVLFMKLKDLLLVAEYSMVAEPPNSRK